MSTFFLVLFFAIAIPVIVALVVIGSLMYSHRVNDDLRDCIRKSAKSWKQDKEVLRTFNARKVPINELLNEGVPVNLDLLEETKVVIGNAKQMLKSGRSAMSEGAREVSGKVKDAVSGSGDVSTILKELVAGGTQKLGEKARQSYIALASSVVKSGEKVQEKVKTVKSEYESKSRAANRETDVPDRSDSEQA